MSECLYDSLSEIVDRYLVRAGVDHKKYFVRYLTIAGEIWQDVFQRTLWSIKSVWMPTKSGDPFNYVDMPKDCMRLLSIAVDDKCDLIQPLFYNPQLNVVAKPKVKKCGCTCDCGGLCDAVNGLTATTKLIFTINGVPYYQKCWMELCPNGDILEYCETPTKKYNTLTGDSGDFSDDYNNDYDIAAAPFSAYEIVTVTSQRKICKLEVAPCGCPIESPENCQSLIDSCGCNISWGCRTKRKHCDQFFENVNDNHLGVCKISECGTKIFYKPSKKWRTVVKKEFPDYLLVNYQSNGETPGAETLVPTFARNLMYAELDNARKEYNSSYGLAEKQAACYKKNHERNEIMAYLNPIDLQFMADVQDSPILW